MPAVYTFICGPYDGEIMTLHVDYTPVYLPASPVEGRVIYRHAGRMGRRARYDRAENRFYFSCYTTRADNEADNSGDG